MMAGAKVPVGVYVDKGWDSIGKVFVPIFSNEDSFLIEYAQRLIHNNDSQIVILDVAGYVKNSFTIKEVVRSIEQFKPNHITIREDKLVKKEFLETQDLMLVSLESWKKRIDSRIVGMDNIPSTLIIKP